MSLPTSSLSAQPTARNALIVGALLATMLGVSAPAPTEIASAALATDSEQ